MTDSKKRIGFDRYVQLAWCRAALDVAVGRQSLDDLDELVGRTLSGLESRRKTIDVLNRLWIKPFPDLKHFGRRGVDIYSALGESALLPLCWGASIATYPFFGKVAEITGRLFNLQDDCSIAEVQRRMAEVYGERDGINRATSRVLQSQADWDAVARTENGKRLIHQTPLTLTEEKLVVWLVEATLRYAEKALSVSTLQSMAVIYPFAINLPLAYVLSNSQTLELHTEGSGNQLVALRDAI